MSKHFRAAFFFQMYLFVRLTVVKPRGQCVLKQLGLMTHQSITTQSFYRQKDPEGISPPKFLFFLPSFPSNQLEHLSRNKGKRYDRYDYRYRRKIAKHGCCSRQPYVSSTLLFLFHRSASRGLPRIDNGSLFSSGRSKGTRHRSMDRAKRERKTGHCARIVRPIRRS